MRGDAEKGDAARIAGVVVPGEVMRAVKVLDEAKGCEGVEEARVAGPVAAITTTAMLAAVLIKYSFFDIAVSPLPWACWAKILAFQRQWFVYYERIWWLG